MNKLLSIIKTIASYALGMTYTVLTALLVCLLAIASVLLAPIFYIWCRNLAAKIFTDIAEPKHQTITLNATTGDTK